MAQTTYNGYSNWDTLNASLWLSNEESLYHPMRDAALQSMTLSDFADLGQDMLESIGNPDEINFAEINWREIFEVFAEE